MYRRPFLVLPGGDCVPLEGDWRIEPLRGEWYVLGNHSVHRFDSEAEALARLRQLRGEADPNALAAWVLDEVEPAAEAPRPSSSARANPGSSRWSSATASPARADAGGASDRVFGEADLA